MTDRKTYSTRANANRAARNACKKALGSRFCAYEGPDYEIHPERNLYEMPWEQRYSYRLRGPALEASEQA